MNQALRPLAQQLGLDANPSLALRFGYACVARAAYLIEDSQVLACLQQLDAYLHGQCSTEQLAQAADHAARLANHHQGSRSLDGVGHAAVSASYAVAQALAGKALVAADYAAYALVYGQGGYGAVCDLASFADDYAWQVDCLRALAETVPTA